MVTAFEKLAQNKAPCISAGIRGEESRRIKQINHSFPLQEVLSFQATRESSSV